MSAPNYSPASGVGTTSTDSSGTTYRFNGTGWTQISSGGGNNSSSASDKQIGGWYNNNGQNMRYWGDKGWTTGADPGAGSSGGADGYINTAQGIVNSYVGSVTGGVKNTPSYTSVHPFAFDEALAKENAIKQYAPYYAQLLNDYTDTVERTKSRSAEDLKTTLEQLNSGKEYYTGVQRRALDTATRNTNEGYAGNGLFFSGVRERDIKQLQTENQTQVGNYLDTYKYNTNQAELGNTRTVQDQNTALSQYQRDQTQNEKSAEASNVQLQKNDYTNQYNIQRADYYDSANNGIA